jgi:hypothetical protein
MKIFFISIFGARLGPALDYLFTIVTIIFSFQNLLDNNCDITDMLLNLLKNQFLSLHGKH